jgi:hypothetical protein
LVGGAVPPDILNVAVDINVSKMLLIVVDRREDLVCTSTGRPGTRDDILGSIDRGADSDAEP